MTVLTFVVFALAVARLSVLVVEDRITEAPRSWLLGRLKRWHWRDFDRYANDLIRRQEQDPDAVTDVDDEILRNLGAQAERRQAEGYLTYLLTCQWCVSVWISLPAAIVWWNWPDQPWSLGPAVLLAFSMITGKMSQLGG